MPLGKNVQKNLNSLLRVLISELNHEFKQDTEAALVYIRMAADLPNEVADPVFEKQMSSLDEAVRERLTEIRDLYLNKNSILSAGSDPADMKAAVRLYLHSYQERNEAGKDLSRGFIESKANSSVKVDSPLVQLIKSLDLRPGDIIITEMPFENAALKDFANFNGFSPGHASMWTGEGFERPFAHSVREGYRPPGLKLTGLWSGRHLVFRYSANPEVAKQAASTIRTWATTEVLYSKDKYQTVYPLKFWERHSRDLVNYFGVNNTAEIAGPATTYGEPRASYDLLDVKRNRDLIAMGQEGLRRAIKFASLRELEREAVSKKGQRCTPIIIAAFQASILAPLVLANPRKQPFKQFKGKPFLEYADQVLIPNWQKTALGALLLQAVANNDYSAVFASPFAVDQRYVTPVDLFARLNKTPGFDLVGGFNYFKEKLVLVEKKFKEEPEQSLSLKY